MKSMTRPLPSAMPLALAATMLLAPPLLPTQTGGASALPARIDSLQNAPSDLTDTGPLSPAMRRTFTAGAGVLQFVRDKSGRVMGMTHSASRMRGIEFEKVGK